MPGLLETNQKGQRQEISDAIFNVEAEDTPFVSMLKKDPKPHKKTATWQTEAYPAPDHAGVLDGSDVSTFEHVPRAELSGVAQLLRRPWKISTFADVTDVAGLKSEKAHQKARAMVILKQMMEARCLSDEESAYDDGATEGNETRGAVKWIQNGAQTHLPVDASFRTPTACLYTGAFASFSEAAFRTMLDAAYKVRRVKSTLDGFLGVELKAVIDDWTVTADAGASFGTFPVRTFNQDAKNKAIIRVVDVLNFSTGTIRLHLTPHLLKSAATGADGTYTHKSGLFLDMSMWALAFMKRPENVDLEDQGGGPRGYCDTILMLKCFNPLGHLKVQPSS